jgi:dethiobiotin synthetase
VSASVLFVAGAHTEIGKTYVASALIRAAVSSGLATDVLKPVVSDFDPADWTGSDPGRLLAAAGVPLADAALERVSPWRLRAPLAPPSAARLEGRSLPFPEVRDLVQARIASSAADLMVVEGVGGLMSPIADGATSLDLLLAVEGANVLVVGAYLGAISHGLTAADVLCTRGRTPAAVIISDRGQEGDPAVDGTVRLFREHLASVPVLVAGGDYSDWATPLLAELGLALHQSATVALS